MSYLTLNSLTKNTFSKSISLNKNSESSSFDKQVFLSYRRKDKNYVKPIVDLLKSLGVKVYIDYLDDSLPDKPSDETVVILRNKIKKSDKFILMATPNSKESNWIPWELGLGDGFLNYKNVAILPITTYSDYWGEREYFSIYGYIKKAKSRDKSKLDWAVFYPDRTPIWLSNWLKF
jgi:hypothetical protein